jgi:hypothetical protein
MSKVLSSTIISGVEYRFIHDKEYNNIKLTTNHNKDNSIYYSYTKMLMIMSRNNTVKSCSFIFNRKEEGWLQIRYGYYTEPILYSTYTVSGNTITVDVNYNSPCYDDINEYLKLCSETN